MTEKPAPRASQAPGDAQTPAPASAVGPAPSRPPQGDSAPRPCPIGFRHYACDCELPEAPMPEPTPRPADMPDLIEMTAAAICNNDNHGVPWDQVRKSTAERYRRLATRVLNAVMPVVAAALTAARDETARQRHRAEQAERERDEAIAALTRHAAEAHRRKWAHDGDNQAAFDALHRIGNEILASRDRLLAALDRPADPPAKHTPGSNAEDCPACSGRRDLPYPFICPGTDPPAKETR